MILIADSGSTKTTWMEVDSGNKVVTEGLNPHFTSDEQFLAACRQVGTWRATSVGTPQTIADTARRVPTSIYFYGAGCGSSDQRERVAQLLAKAFGTSDVHVETDMLGACRAVCGDKPGLVGILGTGSNACYYDGNTICYQAFSTGYILGDHGSANHVGRLLLQDYLSGAIPIPVEESIREAFPMSKEEMMDAVYHQPHPNRFLASLAPVAVKHIRMGYCYAKILMSLDKWYYYQLMNIHHRSHCHDLYLVGGFAAHIKSPLRQLAEENDLTIRKVLADPIDGLRRYHKGIKKS